MLPDDETATAHLGRGVCTLGEAPFIRFYDLKIGAIMAPKTVLRLAFIEVFEHERTTLENEMPPTL